MTPWNYYNDVSPAACAALEQLIRERVIPPGVVDSRSIKEVQADELKTFTQWHFFAGGGLWAVAARLAGWPDSRPLVTASCPCQPFSSAGLGGGVDDPRHLWPDLFRILGAARDGGFCPPVVMGEQVAKKAGRDWFHGVCADLARIQIVARTVDIPACAVDAPHERNRLYWVAHDMADADQSFERRYPGDPRGTTNESRGETRSPHGYTIEHCDDSCGGRNDHSCVSGYMADSDRCRRDRRSQDTLGGTQQRNAVEWTNGGVEHPKGIGRCEGRTESTIQRGRDAATGADVSQWADAEWLVCHDGKARRAKPEIPMLVNGMVGRSHLWSLAGNSIVPVLAAEVIRAYLDAECDTAAAAV